MLNHSAIKSVLPHRFPMLLVDRVLSLEPGTQITAVKNVTGNEPCFAGLADGLEPDAYAYPSSLVIESFCQAAGILYAAQQDGVDSGDKVMLFGSISKFRFLSGIFPGQTMEHHVRLEKALTDSAVFSGEVRVDGERVAEVERVVVAIRPSGLLAAGARG